MRPRNMRPVEKTEMQSWHFFGGFFLFRGFMSDIFVKRPNLESENSMCESRSRRVRRHSQILAPPLWAQDRQKQFKCMKALQNLWDFNTPSSWAQKAPWKKHGSKKSPKCLQSPVAKAQKFKLSILFFGRRITLGLDTLSRFEVKMCLQSYSQCQRLACNLFQFLNLIVIGNRQSSLAHVTPQLFRILTWCIRCLAPKPFLWDVFFTQPISGLKFPCFS